MLLTRMDSLSDVDNMQSDIAMGGFTRNDRTRHNSDTKSVTDSTSALIIQKRLQPPFAVSMTSLLR